MTINEIKKLAERAIKKPDPRPEKLKQVYPTFDSYYIYLYLLSKQVQPSKVLEIGTGVGTSAAHFALGYAGCTVLTIDNNPTAKQKVDSFGISTIQSITCASSHALPRVREREFHPVDILLIDGDPGSGVAKQDYEMYGPLVHPGGLILCDDIAETNLLDLWENFWCAVIPEPKIYLPGLHANVGFGVHIKPSEELPSEEVA